MLDYYAGFALFKMHLGAKIVLWTLIDYYLLATFSVLVGMFLFTV